jgi:hypothetical protein
MKVVALILRKRVAIENDSGEPFQLDISYLKFL